MALKIFFILVIILASFVAKSQTQLLNTDSTQIKSYVSSQGGLWFASFVEDDFEMANARYHKMIFTFPLHGNSGIYEMTFCLTLKNKCFKYYISGYGAGWLEELKETLNQPSSGLRQIRDSLKWISIDNKYEVKISHSLPLKGKSYPAYLVEINLAGIKMGANPFRKLH